MQFFDTHCHIQGSTHEEGVAGEAVTRSLWAKAGFPTGSELIDRAVKHDVAEMICVGCSLPDSQLAVSFVKDHIDQARKLGGGLWASIGIHPHESKDYVHAGEDGELELNTDETTTFTTLANELEVVAIGECGLDYFYEHSDPAAQAEILKYQLELAQNRQLPVIFHVREAFADFWPIFDAYSAPDNPIRGVLHSFTDSIHNLDQAIARGLYIGVNGIATFTKDQPQLAMYKSIPLSRLVLETDSPFLTPTPYRGTICEPYHTSVTAEFLAKLRNVSLQEIAAATTANAHTLFKL